MVGVAIVFLAIGMVFGALFFTRTVSRYVVTEGMLLDGYDEILQKVCGFERQYGYPNVIVDPEDVEIIDFGDFVKFLEDNGYEYYCRSRDRNYFEYTMNYPETINCFYVPVGDVQYFWRLSDLDFFD